MNIIRSRHGIIFGFTILVSLALGSAAQGQTFNWNYPASGSFQTTTNWTPNGLPGSGSIIQFLQSGTSTVTFTVSATTTAFLEQQGNVTFSLTGGQIYTDSFG